MTDGKTDQEPSTEQPTQRKDNNKVRSPVQIVARARKALGELAGMEVERVVGMEADDEQWRVLLEVVELRRVPDTSDVLAQYEVRLSKAGKFRGYRQVGHRLRSQIEDIS